MTPLIIMGILILVPIVIVTLFRINAAIIFMSLCVGYVFVQYIGNDATSLASLFSSHTTQVSDSTIKILLLFLPAILTSIFMFHSVRGSKIIFNLLPAAAVGLFTALLAEPLLSASMQRTLNESSIWHNFLQAQALIVGLSGLISLLFLWIQHRSTRHSEHGKKSKHHLA